MSDFRLNLNSESVVATGPREPVVVEPSLSIREVLAVLRQNRTGGCMVCEKGKLLGIFTERDAMKLMASGADLSAPVEDVMTRRPVTVSSNDTVAMAIRKMSEGGYRRLPIVDVDSSPVGMVKVSGIVRYLVEHFPEAVYNLPPAPDAVTHEREGA